ncbi:tetratricopeptide repeat protein [Cecembia calidifontis]|jgi:two-component sensor histidine kinase/Tfp pilus assembly protein PilF|uniref:histidine kinase n=1 Tax=Cecembia calidifontis TaxID=1187080 RepID=A0A4Q7P7Z2_9BACT|nr:tetratricopeptide repeat protein [Cecembia calidifontis]RZS94812.1 two-component sensor histidine kinase [Cecembia calidifontis]
MKYLYLIFFFMPQLMWAQNPTLDSLFAEKSKPHHDTVYSAIYNNIFIEYFEKDIDLALKYLDTAILFAEKAENVRRMGLLIKNKGVVLQRTGKTNLALKTYLQALNYAEAARDMQSMIRLFGNMASIYMSQNQLEQAEAYYQKILLNFEEMKDTVMYIKTLNNIGLIYKRQGNYKQAMDFFQRGLDLAEKKSEKLDKANILNNLGLSYLEQEEFKKAKSAFDQALEINLSLGSTYQESMNRLNLGKLYLLQKQYLEAVREGERVLSLAEKESFPEDEALANQLLYEVHKELGQAEKAMHYLERYVELQEKLLKETYSRDLAELQEEFNVVQKEQEITSLRQQEAVQAALLSKRNIQLTFGTVLLFLLIGLLLSALYLMKVRKKTSDELAKKNQRIETLIRELHHRVKNNLQIVNSLLSLQYNRVEDEGTKQAIMEGQSRLEAMALIHKNLYMEDDFSGLDMRQYMDFLTRSLAVSYGFPVDAVSNDIQLENPVFDLDQAVPLGLIVNELASNAFKYAFENKEYAQLMVEMKEKDNKVIFRMKDNGIGLPKEVQPEMSPSFGLKLVTTLIKQLNSKLETNNSQGLEYVFEFNRK